MSHLFTVKIATGGSFECTSPAPKVYLLSFSSLPDNRLTVSFLAAFRLSLDIIEHRHPVGVVITTSAISKFYSNGLDLEHVVATPDFFKVHLYSLFRRLLTYPMPTIALVNGHAFAGGLMTAMYHDYRFMNPAKGFACLNEVLFGAPLATAMMSIFRQKLPSPQTFRTVVLEGKRIAGPEALQVGLVDGLGGLEEVLKFVAERKLTAMGDSGVYAQLKAEMWRESLAYLRDHDANVAWTDQIEAEGKSIKEAERKAVAEWEASGSKANL